MLNKYPYRAVLFDLFHTLVDVVAAPGASGRYTADILGVDRREWNRMCFSDWHEICRPTAHCEVIRTLAHRIDPGIDEGRIVEAARERQARFDHALCSIRPGVLEALVKLRKAGFHLALVSNASSGEVSAWPRSPLSEIFDTAVFSCDCGSRKPEPAIYREALARVGCDAREALFVGDGGSDEHLGARALGLESVLMTGYLEKEVIEARRGQARWAIREIGELLPILGIK